MENLKIPRATIPRRRPELEAEWACAGVEPSLASMMDDPVFQQLIRSSGLTTVEFGRVVNEARLAVHKRVRIASIGKSKMSKGFGLPAFSGPQRIISFKQRVTEAVA
jgi:hypothetical protein